MRLGLIGLGRIGAFHAETLTELPAVDSLVVTDAVPAVTAEVADRLGAEPADCPTALLAAGVDGVVIAAATDAHPALILAAVEAGLPVFCEKPVARTIAEGRGGAAARWRRPASRSRSATTAASTPAFVAARAAVASGELGWLHTVRSTTLDPAPPPAGYVAVSGGIFRDCSVHDFDIIRWVTGREVVEVYATGGNRGADYFARGRRRRHRGRACSPSTTAPSPWCPTPATTPAATTSAWSCTARRTASRSGWRTSCRCARSSRASPSRPGTPHDFFMDRFAAAYRAELAAFTEVVAGTPALALHGRRRPGGGLDRRGLYHVAAAAPTGTHGRGTHLTSSPA